MCFPNNKPQNTRQITRASLKKETRCHFEFLESDVYRGLPTIYKRSGQKRIQKPHLSEKHDRKKRFPLTRGRFRLLSCRIQGHSKMSRDDTATERMQWKHNGHNHLAQVR
ncbi:hypothetical protein AVEN_45018-1 [Araneus ventricosus]|uniref:Ig-like domain-containing protein n=1 Tax=Araneus ventricosus TaxID=182803 RepID=A0A4Y2I7B5_ARAVE|nr:hypothetical protein AVEN_45018-1 [Araneus ventricosus]